MSFFCRIALRLGPNFHDSTSLHHIHAMCYSMLSVFSLFVYFLKNTPKAEQTHNSHSKAMTV